MGSTARSLIIKGDTYDKAASGSRPHPWVQADAVRAAARDLISLVDSYRCQVSQELPPSQRSYLGQFMTPPSVAGLMASMFVADAESLSILDPGAGVGSLTAAVIAEVCTRSNPPREIRATLFEIDPIMFGYLARSMRACASLCHSAGAAFEARIIDADFISATAEELTALPLIADVPKYNCAILNPPYHKINSDSEERQTLRILGIETSNLYAAFVWLTLRLLSSRGELVAITPRSFCNGTYFRPFRQALLAELVLRRLHIFESRTAAFQDDGVLQENVILHAQKKPAEQQRILISSSAAANGAAIRCREAPADSVVQPGDSEFFIRIPHDETTHVTASRLQRLEGRLRNLGLSVSTGRVVDFRAKKFLRDSPDHSTAPLIYPCHLSGGFVAWPRGNARKPNALVRAPETEDLLLPNELFVVVKRFSSKEEKRRVVAALHEPSRIPARMVAFENHLNVYHQHGKGLPSALARGLAVYLNSTVLDEYFRQFNGHTQVNATDLRNLPYPSRVQLVALGKSFCKEFPDQQEIDLAVESLLENAEPVSA